MRVLHLLKSNKYSGAENVVLTIMDACPDIEMIYTDMKKYADDICRIYKAVIER